MRRILIERARRKARQRHGGEWQRVEFDHLTVAVNDPDDTLLAVHEALERLARIDPVKADIVKLRYFVGLGQPEIAASLGLSEPTLRRHWAYARAWLCAELKGEKNLPPG
jgi:RNA polymerase sigma factor (TIGR02999 family)